MARSVESQYKDLLNPVKDPEKSFSINISELLQTFVADLLEGRTTPNFNSAALLLQGSASIYGKKVEYLHNLATQLHNNLLKQKKNDQQHAKKETKEREKKEDKIRDPFLSIEIKLGKNLSCLRRKNTKTSSKKPAKKIKTAGIPVNLLSIDNEDKGEVFYDTRGEVVGNKGDFALNKCHHMSSGWLLLPTVNPKLVPSFEAVSDYCEDSRIAESDSINFQTDTQITDDNFNEILQSSPDEGIEIEPALNIIDEPMVNGDICSQSETITPSQSSGMPPSTDEGIGSTPNDDSCPSPGTEGNENVPTDCGEEDNSNQAPMPVRQTIRQALKTCQLAMEDDPLAGFTIDKELLIRKKIQKKNTRCLPNKLKMPPGQEEVVCSISEYCARTFFAMDGKPLNGSLLSFDVDSFDQNSRFMKRVMDKISTLKSSDKHNKLIEPIEDEREIDVEEIECLKEANEDDESLCIPFDDNDIQIDNDHAVHVSEPPPPPLPEGEASEIPVPEMTSPDISHIAHEECENYIREVHQFVQNSDITQRVHAWEKSVKPFLDELEQRESFDINLYGSRILNAFEDNSRKQTMTFRQFCKNKEKWEIHRYFMALLPLANIGNVSIESEHKEDGAEEIFVTLLSRKMHHKELEEFGHRDGSHS